MISKYEIVILKRRTSNTVRIDSFLKQISAVNLDEIHFADLFKNQTFSGVIHCATNYGRDENNLDDTIEANLILPLRLLKNALENNLEFFINTDTILDKRINFYSLSKAQFKEWLLFFSPKIKCINIELEHFYGEGDDPSKFVSKIVKELVHNEKKDLALTLGEQKRSFIYIDDVIHAFQLILENTAQLQENFNSFQVGSKTQISIKNFVLLTKELCANTNTELKFGALAYRANEVMEVNLDISKLEKLGWSERTSIREGLRETIEFEKAHRNLF